MIRLPLCLLLATTLLALPGCSLFEPSKEENAPKARGSGPAVVVEQVKLTPFTDVIEAVGTARANEQAEISSMLTERIAKINYTDGQRVQRGAVIAELVQTEQSATLRENQARLTEAKLQLDRLKALQAKGFATNARVEQQQAAVDIAQASLQQAGSQISDRIIRAPFSGWLSLRRVSPGAVVNAGTPIVTIVDHSKIKLDFTVPEVFLSSIKPGLTISAAAAAYPGEVFRGNITSVDPMLDPLTRAVTARAILPNPDLRLRPGMLMTVNIQAPARDALTVPELAIVGEGTGAYVWKVDAENIATRLPVTIGNRSAGRVEILSGLKEGDRLVTEGTVKIRGTGPVTPASPTKAAKPEAEIQAAQTDDSGANA